MPEAESTGSRGQAQGDLRDLRRTLLTPEHVRRKLAWEGGDGVQGPVLEKEPREPAGGRARGAEASPRARGDGGPRARPHSPAPCLLPWQGGGRGGRGAL